MPTVRELINQIGFDINKSQLKNAEKQVGNFENKLKGIGKFISLAAVGTTVALIGRKAIEAAGNMEMLTTQFEVMLGSSEAAIKMMDELKKFSATTPFALNDLAKGTQQLLSFGVQSDDVINVMRMLGDTAGGNAEKLNGLILAYGKIQTKGKTSLEELNMMAERGLPIFDVLSKQLGVTREEMFKLVSKGMVGIDDVKAAFQTMTGAGGMFFKGMEKQSQTLQGIISTMKDNFTLLLADAGTAFIPVMKEINNTLINLAQGTLKEVVTSLVESLQPILQLFNKMLPKIVAFINPIFKILSQVITTLVNVLGATLEPLMNLAMNILNPLVKLINAFLNPFLEIVNLLIPLFTEIFTVYTDLVGGAVNELLKELIPAISELMKAIVKLIKFLMPAIKAIMPILLMILKVVFKIGVAFTKVFVNILVKAINVATGVINGLIATFKFIIDVVKTFIDWLFVLVDSPILQTLGNILAAPFMLIANIITEIIRRWDFLKKAFTEGGLLKGIIAIGKTLVSAVLLPLQKILELASIIDPTGLAKKGLEGLTEFKEGLFKDEPVIVEKAKELQQMEDLNLKNFNKTFDKIGADLTKPSMQQMIDKGKTNNINVQNDIQINGATDPRGSKQAVERTAPAILQLQLKKLLIESGL